MEVENTKQLVSQFDEEKMEYLTSSLSKQMEQEKILDDEIKEQLLKIGYSL